MASATFRYLATFISVISLAIILFLIWGLKQKDHFAAISLHGNKAWYRNYDDMFNRQIQDRDILYHNIGNSITEAKKADIIILGHSMVLFGIQNELIENFANKHRLKIYNLATAGDGSGEFIRLVIKKWGLHPKLWIINADDHAASFFSVSLDDFGNFGISSAARVTSYSRLRGYFNVTGRNIAWRIQEQLASPSLSWLMKNIITLATPSRAWRNIYTGNWYLGEVPSYINVGQPIKIIRDQNCHATIQEINQAHSYTADIGGNILLLLIPHSEFCPRRLRELANHLKVESLIFFPHPHYTAFDQTHLNAKGAYAFTEDFLNALEKTQAFKNVVNYKKTILAQHGTHLYQKLVKFH